MAASAGVAADVISRWRTGPRSRAATRRLDAALADGFMWEAAWWTLAEECDALQAERDDLAGQVAALTEALNDLNGGAAAAPEEKADQ